MRLASVADRESVDWKMAPGYHKFPYSSLEEYFDAGASRADNRAGKAIDAGRIAFLYDMEAQEFSLHPLIEIYDILREKNQDGCIGVDVCSVKEPLNLPGDTLVIFQ